MLLNEDLLIDIGPDIASASFEFQVDLSTVTTCLLTHAHEDHFDPEFLMARHAEYGTVVTGDLQIVGSIETLKAIDDILGRRCPYGSIFESETQAALHIEPIAIGSFETIGLEEYEVTAFPAVHGESGSLLYSVQQSNSALFYGTDTSILIEDVWSHFSTKGVCYDWVILDHTYGLGYNSDEGGHLSAKEVGLYADRFRREGLLKAGGSIYATHISHEGYLEHEELDAHARAHGYRIPHDGLILSTKDACKNGPPA